MLRDRLSGRRIWRPYAGREGISGVKRRLVQRMWSLPLRLPEGMYRLRVIGLIPADVASEVNGIVSSIQDGTTVVQESFGK